MNVPITPVPAVNAIITIQPVSANVHGGGAPGEQSLGSMLPNGTVVTGFVVNRDAQNNPVMRTELGDFVVKSEVFIKTGSDLVVRVDMSLPSRASIVTIDTLPLEDYVAQLPKHLADDTIAASPFKEVASHTAKAGSLPVLQAVVLSNSAEQPDLAGTSQPNAQMQAQTPPQPLPPGSPIQVTVHDIILPPTPVAAGQITTPVTLQTLLPSVETEAPPPTAGQPSPPTPPASPALNAPVTAQSQPLQQAPASAPTVMAQTSVPIPPNAPNAPTPAPAAQPLATMPSALAAQLASAYIPAESGKRPAPVPSSLPTPQQVPASTASLPPSAAAQPATPDKSALPLVVATIIGHAEDGAHIAHIPGASIKLYSPQPLPTGTMLAVHVQPASKPADGAPITFVPLAPLSLPQTQTSFSYIAPALATLQKTDPAMLREITQLLPVLGPRFTSGLMYFLATVKSGERRGLFTSQEIARIESDVPGFISQLGRDLRELHQQFSNPRFEQWAPVTIPLVFHNEVHTAQLFIRQELPEGNASVEKTAAGQRFLLDLHLSALGDMQLDGFIRKTQNRPSLELFLRSAEHLEPAMCSELQQLFTTTLESAGMTGNMVFQQGREHFVKPQPKLATNNTDSPPHTLLA